ncbi:DUF6807 family protein [Specibacter sp. NPDC078692]|uniref:DUF6807 family protein n=1 Tax=Specibacter sp. NPDC078692 TaxID=3155818 RepID=UPI0034126444
MASSEHSASPQAPATRVALVGVHGFGTHHLVNLDRLVAAGLVEMVAVADPNPPAPGRLAEHVAVFNNLDELLAAGTAPEIIIIATPIQTHATLGLAALASGADVYLEKPTAASMAQFQELREAAAQAGKAVQIGFQSLGSLALPALAQLISDGALGTIRGYSASGMWVRDKAYYQRSRWAGKRTINGVDVVDGVTTNPLAHAVATALHIAGINSAEAIARVDTDLYRAHDIEGDDTSTVRVVPRQGPSVMSALTVCAAADSDPFVTVHGTAAQAVFYYTEDILEITTPAGTVRQEFGRTDLLENLIAHRNNGTALLSSLENSGAFMSVLEAVRTAEDPAPIAPAHLDWIGEGMAAHPVVKDIDQWIARAVAAQATFSEIGAPWARAVPSETSLSISGVPLAEEISGQNIAQTLSPRPYLHPVTTRGGILVTAAMPLDHPWHLGASIAIPAVNNVNFWGGPSFVRDTNAYEWLADHGVVVVTSSTQDNSSCRQELSWQDPEGKTLLHETRTWSWREAGFGAWTLQLNFTLSPASDTAVVLGSPGSNGREAAGYGGFFWRFPQAERVHVRTNAHTGEDAVNGTSAPWLAFSGEFGGKEATLVFTAPPEAQDPWFVRSHDYPGVGSCLAWDKPLTLQPGEPLSRSITVTVADGLVTEEQLQHWSNTH